jgi:hypothetical protein
MKKIFLFMTVAFLGLSLNSCSKSSSSDDDGGGGGANTITCKIGGASKTFTATTSSSGGFLFIYGYTGNQADPTETLSIGLQSGVTGTNKINSITYMNADGATFGGDPVTDNVTTNSATAAAGTFSGTLTPYDTGSNLTLANGSFSVTF